MTETRTEYLVRYPGTLGAVEVDEEELYLTEYERDRLVRSLRRAARQAGVEIRIETFTRTITVGEWRPDEEPGGV